MNTDRTKTGGCRLLAWASPLSVFICVYLWLIAVPAPAAERLGRLFFTPEQRVSLDTARSKKSRVTLTTETETTAEKPPPPPAPEVVTYGGVVRRSDGKATVWLNDRPVDGRDARAGAAIVGKVRPDGSVTVQSAQSGRSVDLRVGQRAELLSGKIEEGYATRGVAAKPEAAPESKPAEKPAEKSAKEEKEREERERQRDLEDAVRTLKETAESIKPPPAPAPTPQAQPGYPQVPTPTQ